MFWRVTVLKRLLSRMLEKVREFLDGDAQARYLSVPLWKPWRDF